MEKILDLIREQNKNHDRKSKISDDSDIDLLDIDINEEANLRSEDEEIQFKILQQELAALDQETVKSKLELEKWKQEAKLFENMMKRPHSNFEMLSDIVSDVASRRDESVNIIIILK
jgi:lantibiotic modifying enzyme